jgi:ribA/ribD-fused uncharacterized protein
VSSPILKFDGEAKFLSNFYPSSILLPPSAAFVLPEELMAAATVEHAYQALKAANRPDMLWVLQAETAGIAKKRGSKRGVDGVRIQLRSDWEAVKHEVMLLCLRAKFEPGSALAERLLGTGYRMLVEGNTWGDRTWGAIWMGLPAAKDTGLPVWARDADPKTAPLIKALAGENWLGRLLMLVRAELDYGTAAGSGRSASRLPPGPSSSTSLSRP